MKKLFPLLFLVACSSDADFTYCAETSNLKAWSKFDCITNEQTKKVYCNPKKCITITSDNKECSL